MQRLVPLILTAAAVVACKDRSEPAPAAGPVPEIRKAPTSPAPAVPASLVWMIGLADPEGFSGALSTALGRVADGSAVPAPDIHALFSEHVGLSAGAVEHVNLRATVWVAQLRERSSPVFLLRLRDPDAFRTALSEMVSTDQHPPFVAYEHVAASGQSVWVSLWERHAAVSSDRVALELLGDHMVHSRAGETADADVTVTLHPQVITGGSSARATLPPHALAMLTRALGPLAPAARDAIESLYRLFAGLEGIELTVSLENTTLEAVLRLTPTNPSDPTGPIARQRPGAIPTDDLPATAWLAFAHRSAADPATGDDEADGSLSRWMLGELLYQRGYSGDAAERMLRELDEHRESLTGDVVVAFHTPGRSAATAVSAIFGADRPEEAAAAIVSLARRFAPGEEQRKQRLRRREDAVERTVKIGDREATIVEVTLDGRFAKLLDGVFGGVPHAGVAADGGRVAVAVSAHPEAQLEFMLDRDARQGATFRDRGVVLSHRGEQSVGFVFLSPADIARAVAAGFPVQFRRRLPLQDLTAGGGIYVSWAVEPTRRQIVVRARVSLAELAGAARTIVVLIRATTAPLQVGPTAPSSIPGPL